MEKTKLIKLPEFKDNRGKLSFLQSPDQVPFEIKRVFWTYDVPGGQKRGGHAYSRQYELIIALSGSFDVIIRDVDGNIQEYSLNRSNYALYIPPLVWRHMENFSTNALSLHLSSSFFDEEDYIRDFDNYKNLLVNNNE